MTELWKKTKQKQKQKAKPKKHTQIKKGAISFQNKLFFGTFLNHTGLDNFFSVHTTEFVKKKRLRKTKVHVGLRNKQKKNFLLFITYIGLRAFIFSVFLSYDFYQNFWKWSFKCCLNPWEDKMHLKKVIFVSFFQCYWMLNNKLNSSTVFKFNSNIIATMALQRQTGNRALKHNIVLTLKRLWGSIWSPV